MTEMDVRALHVDDDADLLELTSTLLERRGVDVVTATSVSEAIERFETGAIDCVVSDHRVHGTDGLDLLEAVRERDPDVPFVLFTGAGPESLASEAMDAGVTDYLRKGRSTEQFDLLASRIERAVAERRTRDRLAENRRLLGALVEDVPGAVYRIRLADGRVEAATGRVRELTGHDAEAFLDGSVSWRDVVHEDDRQRVARTVERALDDGEPFEATCRVRTGDGECVRVSAHGSGVPREDPDAVEGFLIESGQHTGFDAQVRDLHEATRRLVTADTREDVARLTVDAATHVLGYPINGVRLYDPDREVLVPAAISEETTELVGERPTYDVDGESYPAAAFRSGEAVIVDDVETDDRGTLSDGRISSAMYFPLGEYGTLSVAATEPGAFGPMDRRLANILADNAGVALERGVREVTLQRERDRLAALFENIPDPTVRVRFVDREPIVEAVNAAFEETFGLDEAEIGGRSVDEFLVPSDRREEARAYNSQIHEGEGFHGEVRRRAADGLRDFLLHVVPQVVDGEVTTGYAIYTDITERKRRERELERQNERLEEFAHVVSHDLRNPLNVAQGRLELAREDPDAEHFEAVERAHDRMRELIEGLLDLARQGQGLGEVEPVGLADAAEAAWQSVETDGARLAVGETPTLRADGERLTQLLENLFSNSVEHGTGGGSGTDGRPDDETAASVTVSVEATPGGFAVSDDGPGIPEQVREEVFESGFSTERGGTGFGLAIVRSVAEAHGWSVRATESESGGTRVEFDGVEFADAA